MGRYDEKAEIGQAAGMLHVICVVGAFSGNVMAWVERFSFQLLAAGLFSAGVDLVPGWDAHSQHCHGQRRIRCIPGSTRHEA
jgi:hypothetical protein